MATHANLTLSTLASYQQLQIGNGCGISSACAALNLLFGTKIRSVDWTRRIDDLKFPQLWNMRMGRNGPTTPSQQANQIRWIAAEEDLRPIEIRIRSLTSTELISSLPYPNQAIIITIGWILTPPPEITYGSTGMNLNKFGKRYGYHTMLFAAHDPNHMCADGVCRPWGFINSWMDGGKELCWMSDPEFSIAWSIYTPFGKFRSALILTRSEL